MPKNGMMYRKAPLAAARLDGGPASLDEASRSVDITLSTEQPVMVYDYERGRAIQEILLMSGAEIPVSAQLVMLDAHSRYGTEDIIGSVREIRVEGDTLVGRAYFSAAPEAESPWTKVREGHLTDFSVGYRVDESTWIPAGQESVISGRIFAGPVQIVTRWTPRELSAVPIGADNNAKARSAAEPTDDDNTKEEIHMNEKLRKFLERRGLPVTATEEEARAFLDTLGDDDNTMAPPPSVDDLDHIRSEAQGKERERIREIDALCTRYGCEDMARQQIIGGQSLDECQRAILEALHIRTQTQAPAFSGVRLVADERDKFRAAACDGLLLKAGLSVDAPAPGALDVRGFSLPELARECLRMAGQDHRGNIKEVIGRAMTTSDFPYVLQNLATKSLQTAWAGTSETWNVWCGIGSVSDFKTYYDNALSEHDDLEEVPESGEIKFGAFTEKVPETYKAATYAKKFRITRQMIVNDDLGAISEMPARRAEAAARKVGDVAYAVLTANGNMGDGYPVFSSTYHANDAVSGYRSAPGIANLGEAIRAIGVQKDIGGKRRLNIRPEFFLAPKTLEGAAEIFFKSGNFSDHSTVATDSSFASTRVNPYSGNYFTRVYDARLDDDSVYAWYLAGPRGRTVKVVFLNGVQSPILEMRNPGFTIEGVEYMVSIDVGAYATDYRGLYRNEGA